MTLTPRQVEILQLIADGKTASEIAFALGISILTVKNHLVGVRHRLGAFSSAQAVAIGIRRGLIN